ncbi:unnamed protein product [Rotaria sp. Silwood2]|nr:unnamed protein product [Rotaria sp. Silwood2]
MQIRSTLYTSSKNLFTNIKRLDTRDLLSYGQLSYDTILISIQTNNLSLFDRLFSRHDLNLTLSLQILIEIYDRSFIYIYLIYFHQSNLYDLCDEYFRTWFDEDYLMISLISYNVCKSGTLLGQATTCSFLIESDEVDLNSYDILLSLIKDDNLTQKIISISLEKLLIVGQYRKNDI